jgi:hypothetical protein
MPDYPFVNPVYQRKADKFSKRLWTVLWPGLLGYMGFVLFSMLIISHNDEGIVILAILTFVVALFMIVYSAYKRALRKIIAINYKNGLVEFEIVEKDNPIGFVIHKDSIRAVLKWQGKRFEVLVLSLFDGEKKIYDFYSNERKGVNTLESIVYIIHQIKHGEFSRT